ncbi:acyl-CoA thioesterase/bile acid-CoA:amino acid N-acyltransferase family protein [Kribbella lupini]|uniref:Acyl-CoA thioester hydrolase/BAAT C-terminal domain-containing protein n=1 Tax=Kribbella lupini TaxID=291602 RepID=A0ABP4LU12_9ACTN
MRRVLVVLAVLVLVATGCSGPGEVRVDVGPEVVVADEVTHVKVTGLGGGDRVEVVAEATDRAGKNWRASASYEADDVGVVDLDRAAPVGGSYGGVDGMGLFWAMNPPDGDPDQQFYLPEVNGEGPHAVVRISVRDGAKTLATATQTRRWATDGVTDRALTLAKDQVVGGLFLPKPDGKRHPAVLLLGGSEGGMSQALTAALLASHGFPALTVAYFGAPGLPKALKEIPLEYFRTAASILASQPGVDRAHVVAFGPSRGAEAALLIAENFPTLIHGAILYAPSAKVVAGFPDYLTSAWTLHGEPLATDDLIPVDRVSGPVLTVAGTADGIWPSAPAAQLIVTELDAAENPYPHKALVYPGAGHNVGTYPYMPQGTRVYEPAADHTAYLGGDRPTNAAAQADAWPKVLALLRNL